MKAFNQRGSGDLQTFKHAAKHSVARAVHCGTLMVCCETIPLTELRRSQQSASVQEALEFRH